MEALVSTGDRSLVARIGSPIVVQSVSFAFEAGQKGVLQDISFTVPARTVATILGPSGSGKSTLLRLIAGLLPTSAKNIVSGKITIGELSPKELLARGGLAFMFQEPALLPHMNVYKNICLPFLSSPLLQKTNDEKIQYLIDYIGLRPYIGVLPHQLSGGTKTRVALARSFVTEPSVLLLDEPFTALDVGWRHELYGLLKSLQDEFECTIVMVTHDIDEAIQLGSQALVLGASGHLLRVQEIRPGDDYGKLSASLVDAVLSDHPARNSTSKKRS